MVEKIVYFFRSMCPNSEVTRLRARQKEIQACARDLFDELARLLQKPEGPYFRKDLPSKKQGPEAKRCHELFNQCAAYYKEYQSLGQRIEKQNV